MKGRRMSYLNPVRMYVFTSAIFFLIFFSLINPKDAFKITEGNEPLSLHARDSIIQRVEKKLKRDTANVKLKQKLEILRDTSEPLTALDLAPLSEDFTMMSTIGRDYKSRHEYDSLQKVLPASEKDGWLKGLWNKRAIGLNEKYKKRGSFSLSTWSDSLLHKLPYLLFVSLPFFALILKLLYIRRRKEFYYADHGIFTIHHYIFSFILLLFIFLWDKMDDMTGWSIWGIFQLITILFWPAYLFLAMKRFYRQGIGKTFVKFVLLNILGFIVAMILLVFFFLFSIFQL